MKKTILLTSIFAVGAVFAADPAPASSPASIESQNAIGVLQVATTSKPGKILLAVPFAGYGADENGVGQKIKATELVSPANLADGTKLYVPNATSRKYDVWTVNNKEWSAVESIDIDKEGLVNKIGVGEGTIDHGSAIWLEFPNDTRPQLTLLGQGDVAKTSIALAKDKWNLIGNPGVDDFNLVTKIVGADSGDQITVQKAKSGELKTYTRIGNAWYSGRSTASSIVIAPGDGCWIYAKNATVVNFQ